jgi:hypothetical protein
MSGPISMPHAGARARGTDSPPFRACASIIPGAEHAEAIADAIRAAELFKGYDAAEGEKSPYLETSPSWLAWMLGRYFASHGVREPLAVATAAATLRADNVLWMPITASRALWRGK